MKKIDKIEGRNWDIFLEKMEKNEKNIQKIKKNDYFHNFQFFKSVYRKWNDTCWYFNIFSSVCKIKILFFENFSADKIEKFLKFLPVSITLHKIKMSYSYVNIPVFVLYWCQELRKSLSKNLFTFRQSSKINYLEIFPIFYQPTQLIVDASNDWLTDSQYPDWLIDWLILNTLIDWLIDWFSIPWLIDWLIDSQYPDRLIDWFSIPWLIDWLIDSQYPDRLIDWFSIPWLIDWLIDSQYPDWLIDWLILNNLIDRLIGC